jgi:hypothetical protein
MRKLYLFSSIFDTIYWIKKHRLMPGYTLSNKFIRNDKLLIYIIIL